MTKQPYVYILSSGKYGTLYTGVTSNLLGRLYQHREKISDGFTSQHNIIHLIWFEQHETMETAILREKRIKKWNRDWKIRLIEESNPEWVDLALGLGFDPVSKVR